MKGGGTYHGKNGLISGSSSVEWVQGSFVAKKQPLTWYKPIFDAPAGDEPLALDMNSMGKGQVWINGQSIGRYWPAYKATGGPCTTCNYTGYYDEKKCLSNCGEASQRWYHVPRSWLKPRGNLLVVFEELGGIPYGISLVKREIYSVCADIYEWQPSLKIYEMQASGKANKPLRPKAHLSCSPDQKISTVKFASFGTPQGGCGSFQQGSCHAHDSYDIFNKDIIHAMPHDAHPMGVLVSAMSALSVFHPDANPALKSRCKPQHRSICSRTTPRRTASRTAHRQPHHQQALHLRFRWWNDLRLWQDLNLARNQPLKWYIVPMVSLANPNLSRERIDLTKIVSLIYVIDDIFDIYGTISELTLFTEAVNMWDISDVEQLPYYMKSTFKALYDTTNEIAYRIYEKHGFNPIEYLQTLWARLFEAFLVETKWFSSGHIPGSEEYLKNGIVSSGVQVFLGHMFYIIGDGASKENANLIDNNHDIVSSVSKILRLSDDLESEQDVNQDDRDGSYIKCFLKEHEYCSDKTAREYVRMLISDTWKCLNKESLYPNYFSENFLKGSLNLARLVPSMYSYHHNNSFDLIEEYTRSILHETAFDTNTVLT